MANPAPNLKFLYSPLPGLTPWLYSLQARWRQSPVAFHLVHICMPLAPVISAETVGIISSQSYCQAAPKGQWPRLHQTDQR